MGRRANECSSSDRTPTTRQPTPDGIFHQAGALSLFLILLASTAGAAGPVASMSATQTLTATIAPIGKVSVPATVRMTAAAGKFTSYSASLTIQYRVRTTVLGAGNISLLVTSDFLPAGGPTVAAGSLQYSCGSADLGTPCKGTQVASTQTQTPVLALPVRACTGGAGGCSAVDPNSVTINFTLPDDPGYATGSYSAQLTFIISST
jgi:hypothetical protein